MTSSATLVTGLYDLGRGDMKPNGNNFRPFRYYLEWFQHLLRVNAPLVIFVPPMDEKESGGYNLAEFIKQYRDPTYTTRVITRSFSALPVYVKKSSIETTMKLVASSNVELEFHHPEYIIMIYSKFGLLSEVASTNPFNSAYFFWVDAGYFRKCPGKEIQASWPDRYKLDRIGDKFLLQDVKFRQPSKVELHDTDLTQTEINYLGGCPNEIMASFFGGRLKTVETIRDRCLDLLDVMMSHRIINNEQQALCILLRRNPELFLLYPYIDRGRDLISNLSWSGCFRLMYPTCPYLQVLTVATKEVRVESLDMWTKSATYYGYQSKVIGRDESWDGWQFRTRKYLEALRRVQSPVRIAILTDGTDLFFCGSAWEAYEKFSQGSDRIVIGGESIIAYNTTGGQHDIYQIEDFFIKQCQSRFCFPNGGFVIGYIPDLIKLLESNLGHTDDQAGYMDLLYEHKVTYRIDETNRFIGNLPNLHDYTPLDSGLWRWDSDHNRYYNPLTKQYPIALHFPGHNRDMQTRMFQQIFPLEKDLSNQGYAPSWIWWIVLLLVLLALVYAFWSFRCYIGYV